MEEEFIPYEQSLALKELGFDVPCVSYHKIIQFGKNEPELMGGYTQINTPKNFNDDNYKHLGDNYNIHIKSSNYVSIPTYHQIFRWFREKHNFDIEIGISFGSVNYSSKVVDRQNYKFPYIPGSFVTYREAEDACLNKLIEILKGYEQIRKIY